MRKFIFNILLIISAILFIGGIIWDLVIFFDNWKYVLSPFGKLVTYWKPTVIIILAYILFMISLEYGTKSKR